MFRGAVFFRTWCICAYDCTTEVHDKALNSSDGLPSYPRHNHHSSDLCLLECRETLHSEYIKVITLVCLKFL